MKSVPGVDSVKVSLEKGLASVTLKPGNSANLKQIQEAITKNGFTMKSSQAVVAGTLAVSGGAPQLKVSGSNELLTLVSNGQQSQTVSAMDGKAVVVTGVIPEFAKGETQRVIQATSVSIKPDQEAHEKQE